MYNDLCNETNEYDNEVAYLEIDSKNTFSFANEEEEKKKFHNTIDPLTCNNYNEAIDTEIKKFLRKFINDNSSKEKLNFFDMSIILSATHIKKRQEMIKQKITEAMNNILNNSYESKEFTFNKSNINNLSIILFYSFWKIQSNLKKNFHINTQVDFYNALFDVNYNQIDILSSFINVLQENELKDLNDNESISTNITRSTCNNNSKEEEAINSNSDIKNKYKYEFSEVEKYNIPAELIVVLNKFRLIKRLNFAIYSIKKEQISQCLIILFNVKWLFQSLIEVELDYLSIKINDLLKTLYSEEIKNNQRSSLIQNIDSFEEEIQSKHTGFTWNPIYNIKTLYNMIGNVRDISTSIILSKSSEKDENNKALTSIIKDNESILKIGMLYSYFISQWDKVKIIMIRLYDSLSNEFNITMQHLGINLPVNKPSFILLFRSMKALSFLSIEFNSLDSPIFEQVIAMISKSKQMRQLKIDFFASKEYYSLSSLYKLYKNLNINTSELFFKQPTLESTEINEASIEQKIINKLLNNFAKNLNTFLYAIRHSYLLKELELNINLPRIIEDDDYYTLVLTKFLFNLIIFLATSNHMLGIVRIIAPNLPFNDRKCPLINQFLENIDMTIHGKVIQRLSIQLRFTSVVNVSKLIMKSLQWLFIGDLDHETFKAFSKFYCSEDFKNKSQLISLSISLSVVIMDISAIKEDFYSIYKHHPYSLLELILHSNLNITNDELIPIYILINHNSVKKYIFQFSQQSTIESLQSSLNNSFIYSNNNAQDYYDKLKFIYKKFIHVNKAISSTIVKKGCKILFKLINAFILEPKEILFSNRVS